ncbi:MAG: hypothetical protein KTR31_12075 [Myxococcales bacterium]|nr:hypothetical protein [Myxococcales bacterium]
MLWACAAWAGGSAHVIAAPYEVRARVRRHGFNAIVEGGPGIRVDDDRPARLSGMGRVAVGAYQMSSRMAVSEHVFYELSPLSPATFGIKTLVMWPSYTYVDLGVAVDLDRRLGAHAGLGWGIVGVEVQGRMAPSTGQPAVMAFVKLAAIGFIAGHNARTPRRRPRS